jgi:hypothetical protein
MLTTQVDSSSIVRVCLEITCKTGGSFGAKNEEVRRNLEEKGLTAFEPARQAWPSDTGGCGKADGAEGKSERFSRCSRKLRKQID